MMVRILRLICEEILLTLREGRKSSLIRMGIEVMGIPVCLAWIVFLRIGIVVVHHKPSQHRSWPGTHSEHQVCLHYWQHIQQSCQKNFFTDEKCSIIEKGRSSTTISAFPSRVGVYHDGNVSSMALIVRTYIDKDISSQGKTTVSLNHKELTNPRL